MWSKIMSASAVTGKVVLWLAVMLTLWAVWSAANEASRMCATIDSGVKQMTSGVEGGR